MKMVQRCRKSGAHPCELPTGSDYTCSLFPIYWSIYRQLRVSYPLPTRRLDRVIRPFRMLEYQSGLCCRVMGVMEAKDWPGSSKLNQIQICVRR